MSLWKATIEALPTKFDMKAPGNATFIEGMAAKAQDFGWSQGYKQIIFFENDAGVKIDLMEQYGQITSGKLKVECMQKVHHWSGQENKGSSKQWDDAQMQRNPHHGCQTPTHHTLK